MRAVTSPASSEAMSAPRETRSPTRTATRWMVPAVRVATEASSSGTTWAGWMAWDAAVQDSVTVTAAGSRSRAACSEGSAPQAASARAAPVTITMCFMVFIQSF